MKTPVVKRNYSYILYIPFCIVFVLLGRTSFKEVLDSGYSYIFNTLNIFTSSVANDISSWGEALAGAGSYIKEYETMQAEIARLKIESAERLLDYEEYKSLKEQSQYIQKDSKYLESKVLNFDIAGDILINVGRKEGVSEGDVVVLGKAFLGRVFTVGESTSLVKLPLSKASSYEIVVVAPSIDLNQEGSIDSFIKSSGVVKGEVDNILIENLSINADLQDGDLVLVRDERVGDILILGTLIGISKNPASTYKEGFVSPIVDYSNILTVFVKVK
jgi:cell shape-determining protein MreC